jgi:hypothetical protein
MTPTDYQLTYNGVRYNNLYEKEYAIYTEVITEKLIKFGSCICSVDTSNKYEMGILPHVLAYYQDSGWMVETKNMGKFLRMRVSND